MTNGVGSRLRSQVRGAPNAGLPTPVSPSRPMRASRTPTKAAVPAAQRKQATALKALRRAGGTVAANTAVLPHDHGGVGRRWQHAVPEACAIYESKQKAEPGMPPCRRAPPYSAAPGAPAPSGASAEGAARRATDSRRARTLAPLRHLPTAPPHTPTHPCGPVEEREEGCRGARSGLVKGYDLHRQWASRCACR